jgi:hypothetical protein
MILLMFIEQCPRDPNVANVDDVRIELMPQKR